MKNKLLLTVVLFCTYLSGSAQDVMQNKSMKGIVADSITKKPVGLVTVILKNAANQVIRTAATRQGGVFSFDKLAPGNYTLDIVRIGYAPKTIGVAMAAPPNAGLDLGIIFFNPQSIQLATVSVKGAKPIVIQDIDKLTYDLAADPESKNNNVLDMMRKVPMLAVDGEDNIRLNGNTDYKILIDGKPSGMMESDAKSVLRSMPASTVQSIEVMTNPPAKYDAEGFGGIINIVTTKKTTVGYNGTANLNQRGPVSAGPGAGVSLSFKQGKFGSSLNAGGALPDNPVLTTSITRVTTGVPSTDLSQVSKRNPDARNGFIRADLNYEIDSLNCISAQFSMNGGGSEIEFDQSSVLYASGGVSQSYKLGNNLVNRVGGMDAALNYQRGFRSNKARLLTFSYRLYKFRLTQDSDVSIYDRINYVLPDYRQYNNGRTFEQTFQIDYVHPLNKLNIEGGIKGIMRDNGSKFYFNSFNTGTGNYETDPGRSNSFDNNQNVYGVYNSYSYNLKNWSFRAGARIELTTIEADFISTSSQLKGNFFNIIPSLSMQCKFKDVSSVVLAFNQRISRPGISQLNPFVDRSNPDFESSGNPDLEPAVANNVQVIYSRSKKTSLTLSSACNFYNNQITPVIVFNPATNITRRSYANTGKAGWLTFSLNVNHPIISTWSINVNNQVTLGRVQGIVGGKMVKNEGMMYGASAGTSYRFGRGWMVNAKGSVNSPNVFFQGKSNAFASWSLGASKDVVKDKLSFSASVDNLFDQVRINKNRTFGPDFTQVNAEQIPFRQFTLNLNYRFGNLKESIKKNKRGIENDDL